MILKRSARKKRGLDISFGSIMFILLSIQSLACVRWIRVNFPMYDFSQTMYLLTSSTKGIKNMEFTISFIREVIMFPVLFVIVIIIMWQYRAWVVKFANKILKFGNKYHKRVIQILFLCCCMVLVDTIGVSSYFLNKLNTTNLYEEHFVDAGKVSYNFPDKKRNVIHIFLESMETTFYNNGSFKYAGFNYDFIQHLHRYADDNISFSDENGNGFYAPEGATWTVGGMVAQTAGLPAPIEAHYGKSYSFLPGATGIGDVLQEAGYNQELLIGSEKEFGDKNVYFKEHGNFSIYDCNTAIENKRIDSLENWGFTDSTLFEIAKEELSKLYEKGQPFHFVTLTSNTHFPNGFIEKDFPVGTPKNYQGVIEYSSKQVVDFIDWIKQQPFYEDTTIIVTGDHLSMSAAMSTVREDYKRKVYNAIINPDKSVYDYDLNKVTKNREFSSFDIFPTVLASIGVTWGKDYLNLGTNLYSGKKTLVEQIGIENMNKELRKTSKTYNNMIKLNNEE